MLLCSLICHRSFYFIPLEFLYSLQYSFVRLNGPWLSFDCLAAPMAMMALMAFESSRLPPSFAFICCISAMAALPAITILRCCVTERALTQLLVGNGAVGCFVGSFVTPPFSLCHSAFLTHQIIDLALLAKSLCCLVLHSSLTLPI